MVDVQSIRLKVFQSFTRNAKTPQNIYHTGDGRRERGAGVRVSEQYLHPRTTKSSCLFTGDAPRDRPVCLITLLLKFFRRVP